jgi:hypothetical protein
MNLPFDSAIAQDGNNNEIEEIQVPNLNNILDRQESHNQLLHFVSLNIARVQEKQKKYYDQRHRDDQFKVGDYVVMKGTTKSNKEKGNVAGLSPLYNRSVIQIHKVHDNLNYDVKFYDGAIRGPFHIQFLRRYHRSKTDSDNSNIEKLVPALDEVHTKLKDYLCNVQDERDQNEENDSSRDAGDEPH